MTVANKKVITRQELVDLIRFIDGGQEIAVEFVAFTDPRMRKTSRTDNSLNPYYGAVKRTHNTAVLNGEYVRRVNEQRAAEGKSTDFVSGQLPWGDKEVTNGSIVNHANGPKLFLVDVKNISTEYLHDNRPVLKEALADFLPQNGRSGQGVDSEVVVRTFNISSITSIRLGATEYVVTR